MKQHTYLGQARLPQGSDLRAKLEGGSACLWVAQKSILAHETAKADGPM